MAAATKYLEDLLLYSYDHKETHLLACEVYSRSKHYLLWLRSLKQLISSFGADPEVSVQLAKFLQAVGSDKDLNSIVKQVIELELPALAGGKTAQQILDEVVEGDSLENKLAAAKISALLDGSGGKKAAALIVSADLSKDQSVTWKTCERALTFTRTVAPSEAESLKKIYQKRFPCSPVFMDDFQIKEFKDAHKFVVRMNITYETQLLFGYAESSILN